MFTFADGLYTKGTRAHTHSELIRGWWWQPKRSDPLYIGESIDSRLASIAAARALKPAGETGYAYRCTYMMCIYMYMFIYVSG